MNKVRNQKDNIVCPRCGEVHSPGFFRFPPSLWNDGRGFLVRPCAGCKAKMKIEISVVRVYMTSEV
jgi:hypothetical protein